ncbi:MAG: cation:proton antiporter [Muribaculaceae bacterium]|nr:cation:proton antiporter [Muribaculaceae bacterium]
MDELVTVNIESLITDLALILTLGAISSIIFKRLKQPVVLGYIVAGFIASPHFALSPSVAVEANIEFWAQIGIIVLLFSLGLEFSFKKLLSVGGSAIVTTLILVLGMMGLGFMVGRFMGFQMDDSIFLGGMLSTSSTTIILKALTDLGMRQRRYVSMIFAVLIVEDLVAVVLLVILSSIAINEHVSSDQMIASILKLTFFLIIWFIVGIFMLPTMFKRFKRMISDETMLIIAMGLCFLMAVFSVSSGFSMALGAFVMGSILAGTSESKRIERIITPVKDLFGAVFFISVGMMVDPKIIIENAGTIALLATVVILGMITFGTVGMLATGQPLKQAIESGFTLTQIGEFSFIIANTGMALGVLDAKIYPIIVTVSVITTFTTPFFIKQADPFYQHLERHLPSSWRRIIDGYSSNARESERSETWHIWRNVTKRYAVRLLLYSVFVVALIILSRTYVKPWLLSVLDDRYERIVWSVGMLTVISPFIYAIITPRMRPSEREILLEKSGKVSLVPQVVLTVISIIVSLGFVMAVLQGVYSSATAVGMAVILFVVTAVLMAPLFKKRIQKLEQRFINNANERENRRTGRANSLVNNMHLAYITVGEGCPFVGEKLRNADLRKRYGVNVSSIDRRGTLYPAPNGDMRVFPGDTLGVVGTEEQIGRMLPIVENNEVPAHATTDGEMRFIHFTLDERNPIVHHTLRTARLREEYQALLVAIERPDEKGNVHYITPEPDVHFQVGDTLWLAGNMDRMAQLLPDTP